MYEKQRKLIFNELIRIRKIVSNANKQEVAVMQNALLRGEELAESMEGLSEQLARAAKLGKSTTVGLGGAAGAAAAGSEESAHGDTASVVTAPTARRNKGGDASRGQRHGSMATN